VFELRHHTFRRQWRAVHVRQCLDRRDDEQEGNGVQNEACDHAARRQRHTRRDRRPPVEGTQLLQKEMSKTKSNSEFLSAMKR